MAELLAQFLETNHPEVSVMPVENDPVTVDAVITTDSPDLIIATSPFARECRSEIRCYLERVQNAAKIIEIATTDRPRRRLEDPLPFEVDGLVHRRDSLASFQHCLISVLSGGHFVSPHCAKIKRRVREAPEPYAALSSVEKEVLERLARGELQKVVSAELGISSKTVQHHIVAIKGKLGSESTAGLIALAVKQELVELPPA
ncbi:MAG: LuxR C-terminal-related transcriptional regulator [Chthoniobacterales bacterium]